MTTETHSNSLFASSPALKKRRAAETRLKAYGVLAILLAALALVALLSTVVIQAAGALTETYVTLPVELDEEEIDPDGERDPRTILRADFSGLTKDLMRDYFPHVSGRTPRRELNDILSSGAAFELAEHVSANPELVGQTIEFDLLASDVTDLYLKGSFGRLRAQPTEGQLSVTVEDDEATLTSTAADFAEALGEVKQALVAKADQILVQADLQDNGVRVFRERAEASADEEERASLLAQADARAAQRDQLIAEAEDLKRRAGLGAEGTEEADDQNKSYLVKVGGGWIRLTEISATEAQGEVLAPITGNADSVEDWQLLATDLPETSRKISDNQIVWIETLKENGAIDQVFNTRFFTAGDSREPELAGIWGATVGTFWTMLVTFALAFPIGVLAAIYLEEFAPKNRFTGFIEVNINNLAAVPSIVFGLLGLAVFLNVFGVPRSAPLAGGIVLALMTLPTIIIAARASIRAVPPSIRDAALGVGASKVQASFHHVLPLAMPGILTGTIIGMAQALGETAPLIMIGMVAFIVDIPGSVVDSATVLPVQVFRWSDFPERAFEARTAAAICVLLVFLVIMNALAVVLRRRFERRW